MLKLTHTRHRAAGEDNLIPMINIIFLLLIFFMVAGQIMINANVQLPASLSDSPVSDSSLMLVLQADGTLLLEGESLPVGQLAAALQEAGAGADSPVVAHVDAALPAQALDPLMVAVREAGIGRLTLVTEQAQ
ncbi:biopolymer transporter ExbD [Granulosicoccaceae sp. 1_MG-2023]|nr:biopolymer transporter ExbD [Granulosicoccaceae sp. 1_MG-2023]